MSKMEVDVVVKRMVRMIQWERRCTSWRSQFSDQNE